MSNLRVAVIKIGARIAYNANDTSGGAGEARSLCDVLAQGGADVHVYTKVLKKDVQPAYLTFHNIEDDHDNMSVNDVLLIINGNQNFFGGAEDPVGMLNYQMIQTFPGPVIYMYCDPALCLSQIAGSVERKDWGAKWDITKYNITRTDIDVICQSYNVAKILSVQNEGKNTVKVRTVVNYPFDRFPLLKQRRPFALTEPVWDLSYGGTMRGGKREKKLVDYYFGHDEDIKVEVFGKIEEEKFNPKKISSLRPPVFSPAVAYNKMIDKMAEAVSHVVIGDEHYPIFDIMSQRSYESILAGCVTFIDSELDPKLRMYGKDKELADFLYVNNRQEVADRIRAVRDDNVARKEIVDSSYNVLDWDKQMYCEMLVETIVSVITLSADHK